MTGVSIGIGLSSAAETLFSQVFKNKLCYCFIADSVSSLNSYRRMVSRTTKELVMYCREVGTPSIIDNIMSDIIHKFISRDTCNWPSNASHAGYLAEC